MREKQPQATTNHNSLEQNPVTKYKNDTKKVNSNFPETAVGVTLHLQALENEENTPNTKLLPMKILQSSFSFLALRSKP